jgi:hypothetical protein
MGTIRQLVQAPDCCAHEVKAELSPRDYCFVLQGIFWNNGRWTWGIERLAFPSLEREDYNNLFINPWIRYDTKIKKTATIKFINTVVYPMMTYG